MFEIEIQAKRLYILYQKEIVCIINDINNPRISPTLLIPNNLDLGIFGQLCGQLETIKQQYNLSS
jgi:hypothetical protein